MRVGRGGFEEGAHHKILQGGTARFSYTTEYVFSRKGLHKAVTGFIVDERFGTAQFPSGPFQVFELFVALRERSLSHYQSIK